MVVPFLRRILLTVVPLGFLAGPVPAVAHPHVWIDAFVTIHFEKGKVHRIELDWTFDEFYSALVGGDFDKNRNGRLDPDELAAIAQQSDETLRQTGYFAHVRLGNAPYRVEAAEGMTATVKDRRIRYRFAIPISPPADPARTPLTIGVYDDSYYIDIALDQSDPVRLAGDRSASCHFALVPDTGNRIYFGMVTPTVVQLLCKAD